MNLRPLAIGLVASIAFDLTGCGIGETIMSPFHSSKPTSTTSDVAHPGTPLPAATPTPRGVTRRSTQLPSTTSSKPLPAKTKGPTSTATSSQFPTAKPAPGRPGLVLNPFKANSYIDVSGYAPGSKVKDPESQKIFIVP